MSIFNKISFLLITGCTVMTEIHAQTDTLIYKKIPSYRDWKWEALVVENNYITTAIVPSMGGNILQYDFGIDTFLILNPATFGNTYGTAVNQSPFNGDWGFGGFEVWSTPELWPPSPVLTFLEYSDTILFQTSDSIGFFMRSGTEINTFPGIKYEKQITFYKNSTLVKFQCAMINSGTNSTKVGMMNVAEVSTEHNDLEDYSNFHAYFPIRKNSVFGNHGVEITPVSPAFQGEIAPGVFGVEYTPVRGKVYADSPEGWMAFTDERDTQTYVFLYDIKDGVEYPDQGANTEVYIENLLSFMAFEAMSPMVNLAPVTDTLRFTEYFASASIHGPILKANLSGAVAERLKYDSITHLLSGKFGVFSKSSLQLFYCDSLENILSEGNIYNAVPDTELIINESIDLPEGADFIELRAYDQNGKFIDVLDIEDFKKDEFISTTGINEKPSIQQNSIRAYYTDNGELKIKFYLKYKNFLKIDLINISGVVEKTLYNAEIFEGVEELSFFTDPLANGIYFLRISGDEIQYTSKILIR